MSILNLVISACRAFAERGRQQRAYQELMALDDHALADIGIHRSQICALLEGADLENRCPQQPRRGRIFGRHRYA